jgi:DNA-binding MarR family transcriptional regulator
VQATTSLAATLGTFLAQLHKSSQGEWFAAVADLELSLTQLKALHMTSGGGELSVKELAEALSLSLPAASRAIDGLVQRGLVARRECDHDRRSRLISLTDDGRAALERVGSARLAGLTDLVEGLSADERAALQQALDVLVKR